MNKFYVTGTDWEYNHEMVIQNAESVEAVENDSSLIVVNGTILIKTSFTVQLIQTEQERQAAFVAERAKKAAEKRDKIRELEAEIKRLKA